MTLSPSTLPSWELLDFTSEVDETILFDSVATEFNNISGFDIQYFIKLNDNTSPDKIYGEDQNSEFSIGYDTKIIYEPSIEPDILNVFGISSDDTIVFVSITKTLFAMNVGTTYGDIDLKPMVGDLIITLWNNKRYEIAEVSSENQIFQAKKLIWEFILKPYRDSSESDSSDDFLFDSLSEDDFPEINTTTESEVLSAYGDNDWIDDELDYYSNE